MSISKEKQTPTKNEISGLRKQILVSGSSGLNCPFQVISGGDFRESKKGSQNLNLAKNSHTSQSKLETSSAEENESDKKILEKFKEHCPTCFRTSKAYYCASCVRNGNFYSSSMKLPERFAEKRLRERRARQYIAELEQRARTELTGKMRKDNLKTEVDNLKEKIRLIKNVIGSEKRKIEKANEDRNIINYQISHMKRTAPLFQKKNSNILQNISVYSERIPQKLQTSAEFEAAFKTIAKEKIDHLTSIIFPLSKASLEKCDEDNRDPAEDATVQGLAEACQTQYVGGRWITTSHFMHQKNFSILSISLPDSGGYTSFTLPRTGLEVNEKVDAQRICAGLTYICQLVNLVAFLLGIHLPHKVAFSDFSDFSLQEMNEKKFQILQTRLNANVICLCVAQGIAPNHIHPLRMVPNLVALFLDGQSNLGRTGHFEYPESVIEVLEEFGTYEENADSDSEEDWETVNNFHLSEFPASPSPGTGVHRVSLDETASGIVTSAAASVISIFRGIGNPLK